MDTRESKKRREFVKGYMKVLCPNVEITEEALSTGDYVFTNGEKSFAVEYKSVPDLIGSIKNKSLFEEVSNMANDHDGCILAISGNIVAEINNLWAVTNSKMNLNKYYSYTYNSVWGSIYRVMAMQIPVLISNEDERTFFSLKNIAEKFFDGKTYAGTCRTPKISNVNPCNIVLASIKGIGEKKANDIVDYLQLNLPRMWNASAADFARVKGISMKEGEEIYNFIHGGNK